MPWNKSGDVSIWPNIMEYILNSYLPDTLIIGLILAFVDLTGIKLTKGCGNAVIVYCSGSDSVNRYIFSRQTWDG